MCNNTINKDPTTPQIHYLVKCQVSSKQQSSLSDQWDYQQS